MNKNRPYVIVSIKWLLTAEEEFLYPRDPRVAITGYRAGRGIGDIFSVVVEFLEAVNSGTRGATRATIQALAEEMESRLPTVGETFVLTAGTKPVADCVVLEKILDPKQ